MDPANVKLTPRQAIASVALAALFGVPAVAMVELQLGPAAGWSSCKNAFWVETTPLAQSSLSWVSSWLVSCCPC
jgi:hypothetical protein